MSDWLIIFLGIGIGFATGVLSGLFGVGGAVISTPGVRALGATPFEAVGSTLPSIIPSAISGALRYRRDGYVHLDSVAWVAFPGVVGAIIGALLSDHVPGGGHALMLATAMLVAYTAFRTARGSDATRNVEAHGSRRDSWWRLTTIGLGAGLLSGILGIGGGLLMVPLFIGWIHMPIKNAIGTSLACVAILAVPSFITHQLLGHINWLYAGPLCIAVIPGARVGAHLAITSAEHVLRKVVGIGLGVISVIYATGEIIALLRS